MTLILPFWDIQSILRVLEEKVCVHVHIRGIRVRVCCVMFSHRDLNVLEAIGGYSCLAKHYKVLIPENGKFKKHF